MKLTKLFLLLFLFFAGIRETKALRLLGATITYKSIGSNKYEVYADVYRDCSDMGVSGQEFIIKNVNTGAKINVSSSAQLYAVENITNACKYAKTCGTTTWGVEKNRFKFTVDLTTWKNSGACQVLIGVEHCCRALTITTGSAGQSFWAWSMIDLCKGSGNNSVVFGNDPQILLTCDLPVKYNPAASDYIDHDSLAYELIDPMKNDSVKLSWDTSFSSQNPFSVYWPTGYDKTKGPDPNATKPVGFYFNNLTGDVIFTPTSCSEITVYALRVYEFRKDSSGKYRLVGYTTRDFESKVYNPFSSNSLPAISVSSSIGIPENIRTCFTLTTTDKSTSSTRKNDTTYLSMFPFNPYNTSATFDIIDPKEKLKSARVCWEPNGLARNQPYQMVFKVMDNNCDQPGISTKTVLINVSKPTNLAWIEGLTYFDKNKNCKWDSTEALLGNQRIVFGTGNTYEFESDLGGHFEKAILAGNYTFNIYNKFGAFVCAKTLNIEKGKHYKFDLGAIPMMHITGTLYKDSVKNCKYDPSEYKWANHTVYTLPGNYTSTTDASGKYDFKIPLGNYAINYKPAGSNFFVKCTLPYVSNTDTLFNNQNLSIFDSSNIADVSSKVISNYNFIRDGDQEITVSIKNIGSRSVSSGNLWFKFNKKLKFVSADSYVLKTDSTIKWNFTNLPGGKELRFYVVLNADASTCQLNDTMTLQSWLDTTGLGKEVNTGNNYDKHKIIISGKTDPNLKTEFLSNGYTWREGNKLRYSIHFRNTGKKTVKNIWVIDSLPFPISGSTFQLLGASHNCSYTLNNNILKVSFTGINLPDSGSEKIKSKGYFEFSAEIDPGTNTEIKFFNKADIYFDTVIAVKTNRFYNTYSSYLSTGKTEASYCLSDTLKVSFSSKFQFTKGNIFKLILSDPEGAFNKNQIVLDSVNSISGSGIFKRAFPTSLPEGLNYKVKVVSSNPFSQELADGISNAFRIYTSANKPVISTKNSFVCSTDSILFSINSNLDSLKIYDRQTLIRTMANRPSVKLKLPAGKHYITAGYKISSACYISSDTLYITNDDLPIVDLASTTHSKPHGCFGDTVGLMATGAYSYAFYDTNYTLLKQNNSGIYKTFSLGLNKIRAIGTSKYGCMDTSKLFAIELHSISKPGFTCSDADLAFCIGTPITISGSGDFINYQLIRNNQPWLNSFTSNITTSAIQNIDSMKIKGTNIYGCSEFSKTYNFMVELLPTILLTCTDPDLIICDGVNSNKITLNITGANTYKLYKNGAFFLDLSGSTSSPNNIKDKDYFYCEGTTLIGCKSNSNTITLVVKKPVVSLTVNKGGIVCDGDSVRFEFTGGVNYDLYKNKVLWQTVVKGITIRSMIQNDSVYVKGTDAFGCIANSSKYGFNIFKSPDKPFITQTGNDLFSNYTTGNQWYDDVNKITGAVNQKFTPPKFANYFVKHTSVNGCESPLSDKYNFSAGISKMDLSGLKIYPNPASDYIKIETSEAGHYKVKLIDITGKLIKEESFIGKAFEFNFKAEKGIYQVVISNDQGQIKMQSLEINF